MQQNQLLLGLHPDPAGELTALPGPWWGWGSLEPLPLLMQSTLTTVTNGVQIILSL